MIGMNDSPRQAGNVTPLSGSVIMARLVLAAIPTWDRHLGHSQSKDAVREQHGQVAACRWDKLGR